MFDRDPKPSPAAPKLVLVRESVSAIKLRTGVKTGAKVASSVCVSR